MPPKTVDKKIKELELELATHQAVLAAFPDAKVNAWGQFSSKTVNKRYTAFDFENIRGIGVYVLPYFNLDFTFNNSPAIVKVYSSPKRNKLAYIALDFSGGSYKRKLKFARLVANMRINEFKGDMLNSCMAEVMKFIKDHPGIALDKKYLEPRLRKLLLFT